MSELKFPGGSRTVKGAVKLFKDLTCVLVIDETGEFHPASAILFTEECAISGNEPVIFRHKCECKEHNEVHHPIRVEPMYPTVDKGSLTIYTPVNTQGYNDSYNLELTCAYKWERKMISNVSSPQFCGKAVEKL